MPLDDYGEAEGWLFLVLEYVSGGTLKRRLVEPLPPRVAAGLMETIALAVGYVHVRGLLHLDLKPSNILLDGEENGPWDRVIPRISDFGLALPNDGVGASETSLAGIRGTPSYMAPEQAAGARTAVGAAADIHALGAILYELLTGRPPFKGTSTLETLDQVRGQEPVPPRRLNPKIPRDPETIALKCLEKHPSRRYASAEAMSDDLRRWLDGRPIQARPASPVEHAIRWCRRQPVIAALAATLFLTVVGGFLGLLILLRRSETLRSRSEADYQIASRSLDDMLNIFRDVSYDKKLYLYKSHDKHQLSNAMEIARSQEIEFSKRYPLDIRSLRRLAMIDDCLATLCMRGGKQGEARPLTEESISSWEACLGLAPDDSEVHWRLIGQIGRMLTLNDTSDGHLYERWNAKAIATLQRLKLRHEAHIRTMARLSGFHRSHADHLMSRDESDRARRELEDDLDLLRSVPDAEKAFPAFVLSEALTLAALGRWSGEFTLLRSPNHSQPLNSSVFDLEIALAELTASRVGWPLSIAKAPLLIPENLPTEAWTDRIISSIQSDAAKFGIDHTRIPAIGWIMRYHSATRMARQRKVGELRDAHRIADRLMALAERITQSHPDQAAAYMLLSEGYVQRAKNAYQEDDAPVIERWERKALDAAIHAAALEPENDEAQGLVKDRHARLRKLAPSNQIMHFGINVR